MIYINYLEYFQKHFNWNPEIGRRAVIHSTFAKNLSLQKEQYASGMYVILLLKSKTKAIVLPTNSYILRCKAAGNILKKEKYSIPLISLGKP